MYICRLYNLLIHRWGHCLQKSSVKSADHSIEMLLGHQVELLAVQERRYSHVEILILFEYGIEILYSLHRSRSNAQVFPKIAHLHTGEGPDIVSKKVFVFLQQNFFFLRRRAKAPAI